MGFKMKQGPISMKGSPVLVDLPDPKKLKVVDLVAKGKADRSARNMQARTNYANQSDPFKNPGNLSYKDRMDVIAGKRMEMQGRGRSKAFDKFAKVEKPTLTFPEQPKIKIDPVTQSNSTDTPKAKSNTPSRPPKNNKKVVKKKVNKGTVSTSSGFSSLTKAPKVGDNMVKQSSKKIDLVSSSRPQTREEIKVNKKKDKANSGVSRQQVRLAKTKAKAASAKAKTNRTVKSIDTSKPKSANTGAKQISARSSRTKAKRLENRASRIEGRIERKASRQAQRKKIKKNR